KGYQKLESPPAIAARRPGRRHYLNLVVDRRDHLRQVSRIFGVKSEWMCRKKQPKHISQIGPALKGRNIAAQGEQMNRIVSVRLRSPGKRIGDHTWSPVRAQDRPVFWISSETCIAQNVIRNCI